MNDAQLIDRLARTDPFAADVPVPDEIWTPAVALHEIERRTGMQTNERRVHELESTPPAPRGPRRRWLVSALAAGLAVVVAVVLAIALLAGGDEAVPDVGNTTVPETLPESSVTTARDVAAELRAAVDAGDWQSVVGLFAPDATLTFGPGWEEEGTVVPQSNPATSVSGWEDRRRVGPFDWDGDLVRSGFDAIAHDVMWSYALGLNFFDKCVETDPLTITCQIGWGEHPLGNAQYGASFHIHTIVDGLIVNTTVDVTARNPGGGFAPHQVVFDYEAGAEYEAWVRVNRAEFNEDGALFRLTGDLVISPDTVERHRELIAEWIAQR